MMTAEAFVIGILGLFATSVAAQDVGHVYNEDQVEIMNRALERWKPDLTYPAVKNVFKGHFYRPDWERRNEATNLWDEVPDSFRSEREAVKAGCVSSYIKSTRHKTCLLNLVLGQGAALFVYDPDATGGFVKKEVLVPRTWYGEASVSLVDVFGGGRPKFILIEHVGDTGTGLHERIHWMLGWHEGEFRTVLRETVLFYNSVLGELTAYRMNYAIIKGRQPRLEARHAYDAVYVTTYPYDFHAAWRDWLFWDEAGFSFYSAKAEDEKIELGSGSDNEFSLRLRLERNRQRILKLPRLPQHKDDCEDAEAYWNDVGIRPLNPLTPK